MNELVLFATDTENPDKNYNLAEWYDNQGHNASAHTYYLRAAERSEDKLLAYKSLLRASISCRKQSTREVTEKSLIHSALSVLPERPEAYYFLCLMYEKKQEWDQVYTYSILGLNCYDKEIESINIPDYEGKYLLVYQKAISSWWWGKGNQARKLLENIQNNYNLNENYHNLVAQKLNEYGEKKIIEDQNQVNEFAYSPTVSEFDWGNLSEEYVELFKNENFIHRTYEKHQEVKPNDIVFDVGANYGSFTYSILDKKPKEVYCIEPSNTIIDYLRKNVSHGPVTFINKAISDKEEIKSIPENGVYIYDHEGDSYSTTTFGKIIKDYNISKIDFLKFDCEGGEYSIFTKDNYEFIRNNVTNFAGEWHINDHENAVERFIEFRNLYLNDCSDLHVYERNGKDVTKDIFNDQYLYDFRDWWKPTFLGQFMIYFSYGSTSKFNCMTNKKNTSWIVDNFYDNPDEIRKFALEQEFDEGGFGKGFIGRRTKQQFLFPNLKEKFEEIMGRKITAWQEHGMNGRFQIAWSGEPLVYHCDTQKWGGMLYLTPNAPFQCGTTLYAHRQTRARTYYEEGWDVAWKDIPGECHLDGTPWEPVDVLGNVYNRLVIFDASAIHSASQYFGTVMENARLWQMFFFDTED